MPAAAPPCGRGHHPGAAATARLAFELAAALAMGCKGRAPSNPPNRRPPSAVALLSTAGPQPYASMRVRPCGIGQHFDREAHV
jgi:hypothetical protein